MAVTIVSVEGLRLLISVETDLGKFVPTARLQTNLTFLMRKLIERIENNASANNPAAYRMLGKKMQVRCHDISCWLAIILAYVRAHRCAFLNTPLSGHKKKIKKGKRIQKDSY
jgi:hypothetical protein